MGVGSTGAAAAELNRRFGIEIDEKYYNASVKSQEFASTHWCISHGN